jgi:aryl-alcohol dehydrogenase-like predicted oxidoreductase
MRYRKLGRTGMIVSEIGFGAWGIGGTEWIGSQDDVSLRALQNARDLDMNFFDTALAYGNGHSEKLIGRAFGDYRETIVASKVPPKNNLWPASGSLHEVFPKKYVLECLDTTLRNLGREQVDLYQFHVWTDDWADNEEWLETVHQIKASGKVRTLGISLGEHTPTNSLKALATGLIDVVQVIYNLFDQSPDDELLPYCHKHRIGVIARVPFDEGSLTGKIRPDSVFPENDFRNEYFRGDRKQQVWKRVQSIAHDAAIKIEQMPEFALRWCLTNPAVSSVIPGMRTPGHVASCVAASDAGPLPPAVMEKMKAHRWVTNF